MARKTNPTAKTAGPKGPVVVEEATDDAVTDNTTDRAAPEAPETEATAPEPATPEIAFPKATLAGTPFEDATKDRAGSDDPDAILDTGEAATNALPEAIDDATAALETSEGERTSNPADAIEDDTETAKRDLPRPAPVQPERQPAAPQVTVQKVGFVPLVLGGVIAAALGFGAAWFYFGQQETVLANRIAAQDSALTELKTQLDAIPTATVDLGPIEEDLAQASDAIASLRTELSGVTADLAAFEDRVNAVERAPGVDGTLAETAIASWERELDGLRAEIAAQQDRMQEIASTAQAELDASRAAAEEVERKAAAAAAEAVVRAALARVQVAIDSGTPFDAALADLTEAGIDTPAALTEVAADGVPTITALDDAFPEAARAALAAARSTGEADADINPVTAFLRNQFNVRSVTPREGDDPDAILSRAGAALGENRLTDALAEIESLPEVSRVEMADWTRQAETRLAAMSAVESLDQSMNN